MHDLKAPLFFNTFDIAGLSPVMQANGLYPIAQLSPLLVSVAHDQFSYRNSKLKDEHPIAKCQRRDAALRDDPFYELSQAAFRFYLHPRTPYSPQLPCYYQNIQRGFLEKFRRRVPPGQYHNVRYLFAASYVTGANHGAEIRQAPPADLPAIQQAKTDICASLSQHPDTEFVMAYLGETENHPNHRRNVALIARHELNWMCRLAQQEGGLQSADQARRSNKHPSP